MEHRFPFWGLAGTKHGFRKSRWVSLDSNCFCEMGVLAPAYYAFSARSMLAVAEALRKKEEDTAYRGLVTDEIRPKMIAHLRELIKNNRESLDTGFLSVLFLMDVLCKNERETLPIVSSIKQSVLAGCMKVEHGATTMWESWGVEWMYWELGGQQAS